MNTPYVKEYNKDGILLNPIRGMYSNPFPNRQQRRSHLQKSYRKRLKKAEREEARKTVRKNAKNISITKTETPMKKTKKSIVPKVIIALIIVFIAALIFSIKASAQQEPVKIVFNKERKLLKQVERFSKVDEYRKAYGNTIEIHADDKDLRIDGLIFNLRVIKKRHYKYIVNPLWFGFGYEKESLNKTKK